MKCQGMCLVILMWTAFVLIGMICMVAVAFS